MPSDPNRQAWEAWARAHQWPVDREPDGSVPLRIRRAWAAGKGIQSLADRGRVERERAQAALDAVERELLSVARVMVVRVVGDDLAVEVAGRFIRQAGAQFERMRQWQGNTLGQLLAGCYRQLAEQLLAGERDLEVDCQDLNVRERRALARVLYGTQRRASTDLGVQHDALSVLQRIAEAAAGFAGPDPDREAQERALWRRDEAWQPYATSDLVRG